MTGFSQPDLPHNDWVLTAKDEAQARGHHGEQVDRRHQPDTGVGVKLLVRGQVATHDCTDARGHDKNTACK